MFKGKETPQKGEDNQDFYINENGLMVFTEFYHKKRGYCCKNGCKHCPYGYKKSSKTF
ncbi:MAG TPA: DUF5522 domain-containing protein [Cytophagales bacterium]|nr:DUF5522 domain-containing protein [Cytophagales bacterium]